MKTDKEKLDHIRTLKATIKDLDEINRAAALLARSANEAVSAAVRWKRLAIVMTALLGLTWGSLIFTIASADEAFEYKLLVGSYHLPQDDYCEFNPGLVVTAHKQLSGMVYKNSECNTGAAVFWSNPISKHFSYSFGGAIGYEYAPVVPFVTLNWETERFFGGIIPGQLVGHETVLFYGIKF